MNVRDPATFSMYFRNFSTPCMVDVSTCLVGSDTTQLFMSDGATKQLESVSSVSQTQFHILLRLPSPRHVQHSMSISELQIRRSLSRTSVSHTRPSPHSSPFSNRRFCGYVSLLTGLLPHSLTQQGIYEPESLITQCRMWSYWHILSQFVFSIQAVACSALQQAVLAPSGHPN